MRIESDYVTASLQQLTSYTNRDIPGDVHLYRPNVEDFVRIMLEYEETLSLRSRILNVRARLDPSDWIEFCLSFVRAYQLRQFFELYRDLDLLPQGVSPSKLRGACDIPVPGFLVDATRELLRPMHHNGHVYVPLIVNVEEELVQRSVDNQDGTWKRVCRNGAYIGKATTVHANIGVYIRRGMLSTVQAAYRGVEFKSVIGQECLEIAPLTFQLRTVDFGNGFSNHMSFVPEGIEIEDKDEEEEKEERMIGLPSILKDLRKEGTGALRPDFLDKYDLVEHGGRFSCLYHDDPNMIEERMQSVRLIAPFVVYALADDQTSQCIDLLLAEAVPFKRMPNIRTHYGLFTYLVEQSCYGESGDDHNPEIFRHIFFSELSDSFDKWNFPSLGSVSPEYVPASKLGTKPAASRRDRRGTRRGRRQQSLVAKSGKTAVATDKAVYDGGQTKSKE